MGAENEKDKTLREAIAESRIPAMVTVNIAGGAARAGYLALRRKLIDQGVQLGGPEDVIVRLLEAAAPPAE